MRSGNREPSNTNCLTLTHWFAHTHRHCWTKMLLEKGKTGKKSPFLIFFVKMVMEIHQFMLLNPFFFYAAMFYVLFYVWYMELMAFPFIMDSVPPQPPPCANPFMFFFVFYVVMLYVVPWQHSIRLNSIARA